MPKSLRSPRHKALLSVLVASRREAGLTQVQFAERLKRPQSWVAQTEIGQRRLDVVELFDVAEALGVDIHLLIDRIDKWNRTNR